MFSLLLPIIYLAFISLGLPDALLGAAWPNMYEGLGVSVSSAGTVSMIIAGCTIISSLLCERLSARFGTGKITLVSVFLTALALFGFSISHSFLLLCVFAVPYGIGAGSVDAVLNNYVASHYKARHMNWLHCMWGIGCSIGPVIMGRAIAASSWNMGYRIISILQICLTLILLLGLPLWKNGKSGSEEDDVPQTHHPIGELIKLPGVKQVLACFFCYCALETTAGMWAASYCSLFRGIPAEQAASWASLFYIGITAGRFICGFLSYGISDQNMIRLGHGFAALGIILVLLPGGNYVLLTGLVCIGLGCAPVYPSLIHETPESFGKQFSQGIIGLQMACAYIGTTIMPPLFGLLAEKISFALYPWFLAVMLAGMFVTAEQLHKATATKTGVIANNV